jgi:hypothetical protein
VCLRVDVNPRVAGLEHVEDGRCDPLALHPVEGLRERCGPERSEIERQLLSPRGHPSRILATLALGFRTRLLNHVLIRIEADDFGVEGREEQRDPPVPEPTSSNRPVPSRSNSSLNAVAISGAYGSRPVR